MSKSYTHAQIWLPLDLGNDIWIEIKEKFPIFLDFTFQVVSGKLKFQSSFFISALYLSFTFINCGKNDYQTPLIGPQRPSWRQRKNPARLL